MLDDKQLKLLYDALSSAINFKPNVTGVEQRRPLYFSLSRHQTGWL